MTLEKPDIKAPSNNKNHFEVALDKKNSNDKKFQKIILLLSIIIICLLLIIVIILIAPPSPFTNVNSEKEKTIIHKETEKKSYVKSSEISDVQEEVIIEKNPNNEIKENFNKTEEKNELDEKFNNSINEALIALEKKHYNMAYKKIQAAEKIKKNNEVTQEIKERITKEVKNNKIKNLIYKAGLEEKDSQWKNALSYYEKALEIDAGINSILVKRQRIIEYIKIDEFLEEIINKPERLQNIKILTEVKKSLRVIKNEMIENKVLTSKIKTAEKIVTDAETAVIVTIVSDNNTEITLYKVGHFGKLVQKEIELRPGNYTLVGTRDGYRDVRKNLIVKAGHNPIAITIMCREAI